MKELKVNAVLENVPVVTDFIDEQLDNLNCPIKTKFQIDVAIDEIFSNIARYAYGDGTGDALIQIDYNENTHSISITFIDSGIQYNPLEKMDPDTTAPLSERPIGGLGIFIVKKTMDDMIYRYEDEKNILTIIKNIE